MLSQEKFDPLWESEADLTLKEVASALRPMCDEKDSIIFTAEEKKEAVPVITGKKDDLYTLTDLLSISSSPEEFLMKMESLSLKFSLIESKTQGQAENPFWVSIRKHMITASMSHDVKTRIETQRRQAQKGAAGVDMKSIFQTVSASKKVNPKLPALKYGRAMETEAVHTFISDYKHHHKDVTVKECGIYICKDAPFIGGSPDRVVSCKCCGEFCLEVKSPFLIPDKSPLDDDVILQKVWSLTQIINITPNVRCKWPHQESKLVIFMYGQHMVPSHIRSISMRNSELI